MAKEDKKLHDEMKRRDAQIKRSFDQDSMLGAKMTSALHNNWNLLLEEYEMLDSPNVISYFSSE